MLLLLLQLVRAGPPTAGVFCPLPEDTLTAAKTGVPLPLTWIRGFVRGDCANPGYTFVAARLDRDTAALAHFERLVTREERDSLLETPKARANMLYRVIWYRETDILPVLLEIVAHPPASFEDAYAASYHGHPFSIALLGLARYVRDSRQVQDRIRELEKSDTPYVRSAAFWLLLHANDSWSRAEAARFPVRDLSLWDRAMRDTVLRSAPCARGTYFGWRFFSAREEILGCLPPPPRDGWF